METSKEYYDKIISDYKSNGSGLSLRKYCMDEGVDCKCSIASLLV